MARGSHKTGFYGPRGSRSIYVSVKAIGRQYWGLKAARAKGEVRITLKWCTDLSRVDGIAS